MLHTMRAYVMLTTGFQAALRLFPQAHFDIKFRPYKLCEIVMWIVCVHRVVCHASGLTVVRALITFRCNASNKFDASTQAQMMISF